MYLLTGSDVRAVISRFGPDRVMDGLIGALEQGFRDLDPATTAQHPRAGFDAAGLVEWMPVHRAGRDVVVKIVSYFADNPDRRSIPTVQAHLSRHDSADGRLIAIADGAVLTALRTGAASAVASRVLARPDSRILGLVGAGVQAVTQAHALSRLFPLSRILVHDICPVTLASLPRRLAFLDIPVEPALPWRIEAEADILCTATSVAVGAGPVIAGADLKPHLHINAVGSDYPGKCELPRFLLESALVVPDLADQARREGECQVLEEERIGPELHQIVKQAAGFAGWRDRLTVFDSTGIPVEDALALDLITDLARRAGIGRDIAFADLDAGAPKDPYWGTATAVADERRVVR